MIEQRVLILTPTGADAQVAGRVLLEADVASLACSGVEELCARFGEGAGALLVAEEALTSQHLRTLLDCLEAQATWSDVPLIVLTTPDADGRSNPVLTETFGGVGNMTLLERPFRVATFVSAIRTALRARRKQYEVRQLVQSLGRSEELARNESETMLVLNRVSSVLASKLDLHELVQAATDAATTLTGAQFGAFFYNVVDSAGESYTLYAISGVPREAFSKFPMPRNTEIFAPTFAGEGVVRLDDVTADPRYGKNDPYFGMPGGHLPVRSYLAVPVIGRSGEVMGGLFFGHPHTGVFTERAERIAVGIAAQAAIGIDNARLYEAETVARKRTAESEARFRHLADAMPQIVWVTRPDGYHEYFNRRWYDYIGVDFEASKGPTQWADPLHPEDRERSKARWDHSLATGEPYEIEYRFRRHDGIYRWFLARALAVRDTAGAVERWFGTCTDIDDQKRYAEERQRLVSVIESSQDFIGIADLAGNAIFVNDAGRKLVGLGTPEDARRTKVADYFPAEDRPRVLNEILPQVMREGHWVGEMRFRNYRTGTLIPVLWDVFRIDDATGRPINFATVTRDITERKQIEVERENLLTSERVARTAAEGASRMKDEFLATLSHELRTPLNAIVGWSQILAGSRDEEDLKEGLDVIARNARAQQQIIEDLLDMSRIISGKVRLDVQRLDLGGVIAASVDTVRHAANAKGIRLQTVLDPRAGPVSGDPNRLQQVFWNLLTNAIKFTPRGGRVQVVLERINSHLEVAVVDSGEGIKPEFLPHVFDRFRQADASTTRKHGGLGLGLAIVKQLVELHGGTIHVRSDGVGKGSTFTVNLPLTVLHTEPIPDEERRHPTARVAQSPAPDSCLKLKGVRVLVVDDEPDARGLLRRLLEDCEAVVVTAGSAPEAFDSLVRERPDVLVSDIGMPGEDGYSLIRKVRGLAPAEGGQTPALALTAYARSEDRTKAVLAGFQMHVAKPVEPAELIAMVASLAERNGN